MSNITNDVIQIKLTEYNSILADKSLTKKKRAEFLLRKETLMTVVNHTKKIVERNKKFLPIS